VAKKDGIIKIGRWRGRPWVMLMREFEIQNPAPWVSFRI
jgi:hypothetical protein